MDPAQTVRRLVPLAKLAPAVTPTEDVYVIAHMGIAHVDVRHWRLVIDGLVEEPLGLDYDEITSLPARDVVAVLECFGNPVEPDVPTRRVGNVAWRGVPLAEILTRARVKPEATSVWLEAPDHGVFAGVASDHYVKDLPLEHARRDDVLLAWAMNGAPLTIEHGFPLRAFVPGFFGTNAAWSAGAVARVELSIDGGTTWRDAKLEPRGPTPAWQRFAVAWTFERSGRHELSCRATDSAGRIQPPVGRNRIHTIAVTVC